MATERKIRGRIAALAQSTLLTLLVSHTGASYAQTDVRSLDNAARQPFQVEVRRLRVATTGEIESFRVTGVPFGKRLVIEHVALRIRSLEAATGSTQPRFQTSASLVTKANGVAAEHELIVTRADIGGSSFNVVSQPIRVYADPGSSVFVRVDGRQAVNAGSSLEVIRLTVSGHLVDLPQ